jgi:hypothetical protein
MRLVGEERASSGVMAKPVAHPTHVDLRLAHRLEEMREHWRQPLDVESAAKPLVRRARENRQHAIAINASIPDRRLTTDWRRRSIAPHCAAGKICAAWRAHRSSAVGRSRAFARGNDAQRLLVVDLCGVADGVDAEA